jgi:hypothetical protein
MGDLHHHLFLEIHTFKLIFLTLQATMHNNTYRNAVHKQRHVETCNTVVAGREEGLVLTFQDRKDGGCFSRSLNAKESTTMHFITILRLSAGIFT